MACWWFDWISSVGAFLLAPLAGSSLSRKPVTLGWEEVADTMWDWALKNGRPSEDRKRLLKFPLQIYMTIHTVPHKTHQWLNQTEKKNTGQQTWFEIQKNKWFLNLPQFMSSIIHPVLLEHLELVRNKSSCSSELDQGLSCGQCWLLSGCWLAVGLKLLKIHKTLQCSTGLYTGLYFAVHVMWDL